MAKIIYKSFSHYGAYAFPYDRSKHISKEEMEAELTDEMKKISEELVGSEIPTENLIIVHSGMKSLLTKEELQAIIDHEMGHIYGPQAYNEIEAYGKTKGSYARMLVVEKQADKYSVVNKKNKASVLISALNKTLVKQIEDQGYEATEGIIELVKDTYDGLIRKRLSALEALAKDGY